MKLINLTKLTTSNLLSLLGYPCILLSIYNEFIFFPIDWADYELRRNDSEALGPLSTVTSMFFLIFACFICAAFLILILIINKIPDKFKLLYRILFWSGLFFISPLGPLGVFFIHLLLEKYFNYSELFIRLIDKL